MLQDNLVTSPAPSPAPPCPVLQDNLVMNAIRFLTTVSRSVHYQLFQGAGALQQICEKVVVPNLRTRLEDEEVGWMWPGDAAPFFMQEGGLHELLSFT